MMSPREWNNSRNSNKLFKIVSNNILPMRSYSYLRYGSSFIYPIETELSKVKFNRISNRVLLRVAFRLMSRFSSNIFSLKNHHIAPLPRALSENLTIQIKLSNRLWNYILTAILNLMIRYWPPIYKLDWRIPSKSKNLYRNQPLNLHLRHRL